MYCAGTSDAKFTEPKTVACKPEMAFDDGKVSRYAGSIPKGIESGDLALNMRIDTHAKHPKRD